MNIAFIGGIGSGKSTVATNLSDTQGYNKYSFASEVKNTAVKILGRPIDKRIDREMLQFIGQVFKKNRENLSGYEWNRILTWINQSNQTNGSFSKWFNENSTLFFSKQFYFKKLFKNKRFLQHWLKEIVTIDDMRFVHEAEGFKRMGIKYGVQTKIVQLDVPRDVRIERLMARDGGYDPDWEKNESELDWPNIKFDYKIPNAHLLNKEEIVKIVIDNK